MRRDVLALAALGFLVTLGWAACDLGTGKEDAATSRKGQKTE